MVPRGGPSRAHYRAAGRIPEVTADFGQVLPGLLHEERRLEAHSTVEFLVPSRRAAGEVQVSRPRRQGGGRVPGVSLSDRPQQASYGRGLPVAPLAGTFLGGATIAESQEGELLNSSRSSKLDSCSKDSII